MEQTFQKGVLDVEQFESDLRHPAREKLLSSAGTAKRENGSF
jgi:hypothetical protein